MAHGFGLPLTEKGDVNGRMETPRRTIKRRARRIVDSTLQAFKIPRTLLPTTNTSVPSDDFRLNSFNNNVENSLSESYLRPSETEPINLKDAYNSLNAYNLDFNDFKSKQECLKLWCIKHNITQIATNDLLEILKKWMPNEHFCKDSRTLLGTPRNVIVDRVCEGEFYHFGIEKYLIQVVNNGLINFKQTHPTLVNSQNLLTLKIGIDGVPISKSSNLQFWPILFSIDQSKFKQVFVASLFYGSKKPTDLEHFLGPFVNEMLLLENNGLLINDATFTVRIRCICADAPARAFLKNIRNHNAYYGCERCYRKGKWHKRVIYPIKSLNFPLHSDESFINQCHEKHHDGSTPLSKLSVGLVSQIPLDYMHLCCLGVMRKLLLSWTEIRPYKLSTRQIGLISDRLLSFRKSLPCEFARKCRSLKDIRHWKAKEFRLFMLYVGPAALVNILDAKRYEHFMLFHCAMYILVSKAALIDIWVEYAGKLLQKFVEEVPIFYHKDFLSYNMHSIQHLPLDVKLLGQLDSFSCFEFENFMQKLKKMIRKNNNHLAQVVKRIKERDEIAQKSTENGKLNFTVIRNGDCFVTTNGKIIVVSSVNNNAVTLFEYSFIESVVLYPCLSSKMGIYIVKKLGLNSICADKSLLFRKCVKLPYDAYEICIPLCHFDC